MRLAPHYEAAGVTLFHGDCLDVLRELPDESMHAVVTDPPYNLTAGKKGGTGAASVNLDSPYGRSRIGTGNGGGFMGNGWDDYDAHPGGFQGWCADWARECLRILKPGGHLVSFGGSRTWHRLAAGIEDAGFEMRDSIAWLYGSGFPKSLDVAKAIEQRLAGSEDAFTHDEWDGWGTALKPAFEPIVVARKPLAGTVAANVLTYGTGALNIDSARVLGENPSITRRQGSVAHLQKRSAAESEAAGKIESRTTPERYREQRPGELLGRWPANVVLDESQAVELDRQAPDTGGSGRSSGPSLYGASESSAAYGARAGVGDGYEPKFYGGEKGGASRMFPTFRYEAKAPTSERPVVDGVAHPTVKPLDLMRWLVRLVTPKGGTVLEPFAGSGTTVEACIREGFDVVAIEREAEYLPLIEKRIRKDHAQGLDFDWGEAS